MQRMQARDFYDIWYLLEVHGMAVPADGCVSICWASANRDAEVFAAPNEVRLDRRPNPHIAFGAGAHFCLGAAHARLIMRELLRHLSTSVKNITIIGAVPNVDAAEDYRRKIGYERLEVRMEAR